jgi:hypothetical protein
MLLLADRNFPGHQLWGEAIATGADLAWRLKKNWASPRSVETSPLRSGDDEVVSEVR